MRMLEFVKDSKDPFVSNSSHVRKDTQLQRSFILTGGLFNKTTQTPREETHLGLFHEFIL